MTAPDRRNRIYWCRAYADAIERETVALSGNPRLDDEIRLLMAHCVAAFRRRADELEAAR